ncbi:C45 family peptidase [Leucobacter sp. M11]|uniref:C45 family peptidase n=1 Tax=Leucobacter sp. M11 TaxID=2993565 RepID=UPI002D8030BD|nr:C45 family peptidase [Leucobacter sp. M11]MEB4616390.1 C45 family autoproteolytic acyltransferase/hydrolase [Leucobacter sp. M11]
MTNSQHFSLPLIDISGGPRERGLQYGEQAKTQIAASIEFYQRAFKRASGLDWEHICARAEAWVAPATAYAPDLVEELRGIAEGSGFDFLELMAINARGEIIYDKRFADLQGGECTTYALSPEASGDGHSYAGQNWDYLCGAMDSIIMLRIRGEGDPDIIMQIEAGQLGRHGANGAGIAMQVNGLGGRYGYEGYGVPQPFVRRRVLQATSLNDAMDRVFQADQQIGANYLLATREGFSISLETTPAERTAWKYATDGILVHGNHHEVHIPTGQPGPYKPMAVDSLYRVPFVEGRLRAVRDSAGTEEARAGILRALANETFAPNSVCALPDLSLPETKQWQTVTASVVDLTTGEYLLADGLPSERTLKALPWNLYEAAGA